MKHLALSLLVVAGVGFSRLGLAAAVNNYWQATDQGLDGSWGDKDHWSLGHLPTGGEIAVIDPLRTGGSSATFAITVDDDYEADQIIIGDPDNATRNQSVTFVGSGSVKFAGKAANQVVFRACKGGIAFDGPSFDMNCSGGLLNYSEVTVKNGSTLRVSGPYISWKTYDNLRVEAGGTVSVTGVQYGNSNDNGHSIVVGTGGVFTCSGTFWDSQSNSYRFGLVVDGGTASVETLNLTRTNAYVRMTSGSLTLNKKPTLAKDDFSQFDISGGSLRLGFDVKTVAADDPWYAFMEAHPDVVDGCARLQMTGGTLFRRDGTFHVARFVNLDKSLSLQIDCDRLVFDGRYGLIDWVSGGTRIAHFYGPTEIRTNGRDLSAWLNYYLYCHGKVVVDTRDWSDPSISRTIAIRGLHSADGTLDLTVRGGGTFKFGQAYAYESCSSFTVEEGVNLELGNRDATFGKTTEWGPLSTERLTLGKDVKVSFTAGEQHICASRWSVDPSVRFTVNVQTTATHGAFPILQDLDSKDLPDALLNQIELTGNSEGWQLRNECGQITVYRHDPAQVGIFGDYEWIGGHGADWRTPENWHGNVTMSEKQAHVFGASLNAASEFKGLSSDGRATTLGSVTFQTNAVASFRIGGSSQATWNSNNALTSYSWVPQVVGCGFRTIGGRIISAQSAGPVVFTSNKNFTIGNTSGSTTIQFYGDVRAGNKIDTNATRLNLGANNRYCPAYRTCLTAISGGNLEFKNQTASLANESTSYRVSTGGKMSFTNKDGNQFYQWTKSPASIVVDGTLAIAVPFRGGANQSYRGSGRLDITGGTVSHTASSVVSFGETLQVYPTTWSTVTAGNENRALAMGANSGTPVIHVTDGWTYGPASGVTPTVSANSRAFVLANGAVATIEANGGNVRFVEGVRGFGTLAISNGTLTVEGACSGDQSVLAACAGATLKLVGDQTLGGLSAGPTAAVELDGAVTLGGELDLAGASLKIAPTTVVSAAKGVKLGGTALDLGAETIPMWRTLFTAGNGAITGVPVAGDSYKFRTVKTENGLELQCKSVTGSTIILR